MFCGGVGNLSAKQRVRQANVLPPNARLFDGESGIDVVFKHLERHNGVEPHVASDRLHEIKSRENLGGADNVVVDLTGNVFHPVTGEHIGMLTRDP